MRIHTLAALVLAACETHTPEKPADKPAPAAAAPGGAGPANAPPANAKVTFIEPHDGAVLTGETTVKFGVEGMTLVPAGQDVPDKSKGHHHLIIDDGPTPSGDVVSADATHIHFGKAQTETKITLPPGKHTLTLQFADGAHASYGPALSATIHVEQK